MNSTMTWKCDVCGYVHRGAEPPDTCPVCGVGRELFSRFEVARPAAAPRAHRWRCTVCGHEHVGDEPPDQCSVCGVGRELFEPVPEAGAPPRALAPDVGRIVIVGAGIAGLTAADEARRLAPDVAITILSKEADHPYYRLNLTRLLAGEVTEESLSLQPEGWYGEQRIELIHAEAASVDRVRQEVCLRDGRILPYDRLVLANGAHPFVPPLPGATRAGVLALRTKDDARAVQQLAVPGARCVCLGGGLLGLEAAGALRRQGVETTVLEGFGWLLPRQLAEPAGRLLQRHVEALGIQVRCSARAEEIVGDERARAVRLAGGEELAADIVLLATGIRPSSYLARRAGLEVKSGVVVDDRLFTTDPAILAAGDVAEHRGVLYGIWPAAYAQGVVAGANAVGGSLEFHGLPPSNRLKVLDVDVYSIGQAQAPDGSYQVLEEQRDGIYLRFVCRDGKLVGANLYGDTELANLVRDAIETGEQLARCTTLLARVPQLERCSAAASQEGDAGPRRANE
jgi:nitrite reductase (NADH) large subunit